MSEVFCDFEMQIGANLVTVRYDFQMRRVFRVLVIELFELFL